MGARGVRVNAVAPTYINTPLTAFGIKDNPEMYKGWIGMTPMDRVGEPDEIGLGRPVPGVRRGQPDDRHDRARRRRLYLLVAAAQASSRAKYWSRSWRIVAMIPWMRDRCSRIAAAALGGSCASIAARIALWSSSALCAPKARLR